MSENVKRNYDDRDIYKYFTGEEPKENEIEKFNIGQIMFNGNFTNDIAYIRNRLDCVVVVEHQSKRTDNLGIRLMMYETEIMKKYLLDNNIDIHRKARIKLPMPRFLIVCKRGENGKESIMNIEPDEFEYVLEIGLEQSMLEGDAKGKIKEVSSLVCVINSLEIRGVSDKMINRIIDNYKLSESEKAYVYKQLGKMSK